MLTTSMISLKPNVLPISAPDYDFDRQNRWQETTIMGKFTSNSVQTFDGQGKPKDSTSDNND